MSFVEEFKTAALAPMLARDGVSVIIKDTETATSYTCTALLWQMEGFADPFDEWHFIVHNDATLGVTAPANGWTVTYNSKTFVVGKATLRGNGVAWDLWTREPEERI